MNFFFQNFPGTIKENHEKHV